MVRLESIENQMKDIVTYEFDDGQRLNLDAKLVRDYGAVDAIKLAGFEHLLPRYWLPVIQHGKIVGSLPAAFDPLAAKITSPLYDPRPGDFRRDGNSWIAANNLGPGDLLAVKDFKPSPDDLTGENLDPCGGEIELVSTEKQ